MKLLLAYGVALGAFLVIDMAWITLVVTEVYNDEVGHLLMDEPRVGAAIVFYLGYVAGLVVLAVRPALAARRPGVAWFNGAALGAFAYGTYAFTNYAMLRDWSWHLVWTDVVWGVFISSLVSFLSYRVARR